MKHIASTWKSHAIAVLVVAVVPFGLASCGSDSSSGSSSAKTSHTYPKDVVDAFTKNCEATAKTTSNGKLTDAKIATYCGDALTCIQQKLTLDRFEQADKNMLSGAANPDAKLMTACAKDAATKLQ